MQEKTPEANVPTRTKLVCNNPPPLYIFVHFLAIKIRFQKAKSTYNYMALCNLGRKPHRSARKIQEYIKIYTKYMKIYTTYIRCEQIPAGGPGRPGPVRRRRAARPGPVRATCAQVKHDIEFA